MTQGRYCAWHAQQEQRLITCHPKRKLMLGTECFVPHYSYIATTLASRADWRQTQGYLPNLRGAYARPSILPLTHYWLTTCVKI